MIAVLVTGSREWTDYARIAERLAQYEGHDTRVLIHGDADGADQHADTYASAHGWEVIPMPALSRGERAVYARDFAMVGVLIELRKCTYQVVCEVFALDAPVDDWNCVSLALAADIPVTVTRGGGE